jgi:hypothetical protein
MRNLWLERNPVLSMFMSAANVWLGTVRGHAGNAMRRQLTNAIKKTPARRKRRRS